MVAALLGIIPDGEVLLFEKFVEGGSKLRSIAFLVDQSTQDKIAA